MEQLSRPYQIALIAIVGLTMVWFVALRHHGASAGTPSATPSTPAAPGPSAQTSPGTPTRVYHGAAPGVEGLTRDVRKAHEAVGTSQQNAQTLENKSAQASDESAKATNTTSASSESSASTQHKLSASSQSTAGTQAAKPAGSKTTSRTSKSATQVAHELTQGKTVLLLFWNPKSIDDRVVQKQLRIANHALGRKVAIHEASANQIGTFGQVTQDVRVYQTPTLLIINPKRLVTTVTGLTDAFSIRQAVSEAK